MNFRSVFWFTAGAAGGVAIGLGKRAVGAGLDLLVKIVDAVGETDLDFHEPGRDEQIEYLTAWYKTEFDFIVQASDFEGLDDEEVESVYLSAKTFINKGGA